MAYTASGNGYTPSTYKTMSESEKLRLDEQRAEAERVAAEHGYVDYNPLANNPRGSEMEILEAERVQAEQQNRKRSELAEKLANDANITEEDIDYIYNSIMTGTLPLQLKKAGIAALIKNGRDEVINNIVQNEAKLSVEQMKMNQQGYNSSSEDRNLQFMETLTILKENNYDFSKLKFINGDKEWDFYRFIGTYASKASEYRANMSEKIVSEVIDSRVASSPMLIAALFVEEEFIRNPQRFEEEYQAYLAPKKEGEFRISYEEFIRNRYHIEINRLKDKLKMFEEARKKVIEADQQRRQGIINQVVVQEQLVDQAVLESAENPSRGTR